MVSNPTEPGTFSVCECVTETERVMVVSATPVFLGKLEKVTEVVLVLLVVMD